MSQMKRILLIEDDELLKELYVERLKDEFHVDIATAAGGFEGIRLIEEQKKFDLIICDINMPEGTGLDVLLHLSQTNQSIPLIFFSSNLDLKMSLRYKNLLGLIDKNNFAELCQVVSRQIDT